MKNKWMKKIGCGFLAGILLLGTAAPVNASADETEDKKITHGTATEWITEDMVNNTPPADYVINSDTQGKAERGDYSAYFLTD